MTSGTRNWRWNICPRWARSTKPSNMPTVSILGRDRWAKAAVPLNRFEGWVTAPLFGVLTAPMRADPRFGPLMQAIGLEDYWRQSRSRPDYRAFPS